MSREYIGLPDGETVETKFGPVLLTPITLSQVMVATADSGPGLTVRGVNYRVRIHYDLVAGKWTVVHHPYFSRGQGKDVSKAARESITEELARVVAAWTPDNTQKLVTAYKREINNQLVGLEKEIHQLEASLAELRGREKGLMAELEALG